MRLEYLMLADADKQGAGRQAKHLGHGARIVTFDRLPASSPTVIVAAVSATVEEAGEYLVELALLEPDGTREVIVSATGVVPSADEVEDARVPSGIGLSINLYRPFRIEGVHTIELRVGDFAADWSFVVRVDGALAQKRPSRQGASTPARRAKVSARTRSGSAG